MALFQKKNTGESDKYMTDKNIVLIGMPGAGKSTVGVVLAKRMGYRFVDSDLVIQETYHKLLHELIDEYGVSKFWELENQVNKDLAVERAVIATGGSAVYGREAMEHFYDSCKIVYLRLSLKEIQNRLGDLHERGVTLLPGQTLEDLYKERTPLYEKYAHIIVDCDALSLRELVVHIQNKL